MTILEVILVVIGLVDCNIVPRGPSLLGLAMEQTQVHLICISMH